jgi:penicillin-binding protein 1A
VYEVISVDTARTMMQLLQAVIHQGTGAAAGQLKHPFGGKTGTTNDFTDAWFIGFSPSVTCGTWIGFDDRQTLGKKETGARAALPMWMDFMKAAIVNKPNETFAAAGAPKKALGVPISKPEDVGKPLQRPAPKVPEDAALDASKIVSGAARPVAPIIAPRGATLQPPANGRPKMPETVHTGAPTKADTGGPAKAVTAKAKSAEAEPKGAAKPRPDRD